MFLIIPLITIGLIIGTAFLSAHADKKSSFFKYGIVIVAGLVTLLFEPVMFAPYGGAVDGGAIQLAAELAGIGFVIWGIAKMIKLAKSNRAQTHQK